VADTLPIGSSSLARAELTPPAALSLPVLQETAEEREARYQRAEDHLAACAAEAGMTPDEYRRQGLLAEYAHLKCDADPDAYTKPFPYLRKGVSARRGGQS
jgi:hypothetical protein